MMKNEKNKSAVAKAVGFVRKAVTKAKAKVARKKRITK